MNINLGKHFNMMLTKSWDNKIVFMMQCIHVKERGHTNVHYLNFYSRGLGFRHSLWYKGKFISVTNFASKAKAKRFREETL